MSLIVLKTLRADSRGFTLPEVLLATAILGLALGMVGSAIFQSLSVQRTWNDDVMATQSWRNGESWFVRDAFNAAGTDLVDGGPPASAVTLTWTDGGGTPHTASYQLSQDELVRTRDGVPMTVARRVLSAGFSLSGKTLTVALEVQAENGATEAVSLQTYLRGLQQ